MLRHLVNALLVAFAGALVACDDFDEESNSIALELVPAASEVVLNENCGESPMAAECSILYLDASWAASEVRLAEYREQAQSAGWEVTEAVDRPGLILTRDGYFGRITLAKASDGRACAASAEPERCADVIHIRDR